MDLVNNQPVLVTDPEPFIRSQYGHYHFVLISASSAHPLISLVLSLALLSQDLSLLGGLPYGSPLRGHSPLWVHISLLGSVAALGPVSLGRCHGP